MPDLVFLKLGGSLITDKNTPRTAKKDVIVRLAEEFKAWRVEGGAGRLVLGHGSGSFGHVPAKKYGTRRGVNSIEEWRGFAEVWFEAAALNKIVMEILHTAGLSGVSFPVSGGVTARDGQVTVWNLTPLTAALGNGLLPVVYGDVVFDTVRGGTILSTEDIFSYLARKLHPQRILLAGIDQGVYTDYPECTQLISEITPENWDSVASSLGGSAATDVTGGMASKVHQMLDLAVEIPGLEVLIFSGNQPGNLSAVLEGETLGTKIQS